KAGAARCHRPRLARRPTALSHRRGRRGAGPGYRCHRDRSGLCTARLDHARTRRHVDLFAVSARPRGDPDTRAVLCDPRPAAALSHAVLADLGSRHPVQHRPRLWAAALPALPLARDRAALCRLLRLDLLAGDAARETARDGAAASAVTDGAGLLFRLSAAAPDRFPDPRPLALCRCARGIAPGYRLLRPERQ